MDTESMLSEPAHNLGQAAKVWLVTGCSTGFGRALVPAILARGDKVIATARRISDLEYLHDLTDAKALQLDVTAPEEVIRQKADEATEMFGRIDVLVNNAGYVSSGVWEEVSPEDIRKQFETNFFGALNVTRSLLPQMRLRKSGIVFFMSSISGWHGVAAGGPYSSSKFALEGAAECLQKEIGPLGIRTHLLVIGQFRTNILNSNKKIGKLSPGIPEYSLVKEELAERHAATDGLQPGDPLLAVERILDVARLENLSESLVQNLPLRIPLGSDAIDVVRRKCDDSLRVMNDWEAFAKSTDFQNTSSLPGYY